jgi:endogenous inhibitor of DNA gyrase (YacG/DUF329 family)
MTREIAGKPQAGWEPGCPICHKPSVKPYTPFCSRRCAEIDLGRWLKEAYVIPATGTEEADEDDAQGQGNDRGPSGAGEMGERGEK